LLVNKLQSIRFDIRKFAANDVSVSVDFLSDYRIDETDPIPVLYQSGYLTIKRFDEQFNSFILGFPNQEVKYGFLKNLLPSYAPADSISMNKFFAGDFIRELWQGNVDGFMTQLTAFFASIPYDAVNQIKRDEQHYQYTFYLLFTLMGQFAETEVKSALGRADAVVKTADAIYVFEFKMDSNATAESALQQIDEKAYLIPYTADERRLVKIGVEFSLESKGIKRWAVSS
jgi:hypothetical protein